MSRTIYLDHNGNEIDPPKADPVPLTNADRIRGMTDEELADWLVRLLYPECPKCPVFENGCIGWVIACKNNLLKWVEKEAEI